VQENFRRQSTYARVGDGFSLPILQSLLPGKR
jgi:hypothetical protein